MASSDLSFTREEMAVDENLGYPKAYAKLCRDRSFSSFSSGPPFIFIPLALPPQEAARAQELDQMFPIIDMKAKPTTKPKIFVSLLWKQLNHLGNAGFDPEIFRVDAYGNVLYYHADPASPLAWDIDHWFPCSRGGLTVASNLRILQWQVCKKKHDNLEFLIPWWDLQVGISVNQFLSIFASSNSDFRHRAFSWLFSNGESEELNACQTVDSHAFPQHFIESKEKIGLAPAALVLSRREVYDASSALRSLDINRKPRPSTPIIAAKKFKSGSKENEDPNMVSNPYQAMVIARDSLRQREETRKMEAEIHKLDAEANELKQRAEEEKFTIQDLEMVLIKRRRRAEKCRRLAEAQSSYRAMLEKMIRDAMHQSVVYKEQVRLNQAAATALMARLEAQKAICDSSERELHKKFKQRDELEKQIRPEWDHARKRSRMDDSTTEEIIINGNDILCLPGTEPNNGMQMTVSTASMPEEDEMNPYLERLKSKIPHKELRKYLEEEQRTSEEEGYTSKQQELEEGSKQAILRSIKGLKDFNNVKVAKEDENLVEQNLPKLDFPSLDEPEIKEDEESRKQRGKGNVEKWLQMLLDDTQGDAHLNHQNDDENGADRTSEIIRKLDLIYPQKELNISKAQESKDKKDSDQVKNNQSPISAKASGKREEYFETEVRVSTQSNNEEEGKKRRESVPMKYRDTPIKNPPYRLKSGKSREEVEEASVMENRKSYRGNERKEKVGKEKELHRSESARTFRRIPSSPSLIFSGMKKRVDCIGKKPLVSGDDDGNNNSMGENNLIKSTIKTIKRAVKF